MSATTEPSRTQSADVSDLAEHAPEYVARMRDHQRHNFLMLVLDGSAFAFSIALLSETTILPMFVAALTHNPLRVGMVGAIYSVGRYAPQLFGAHLIMSRARRKPLLLAIVGAERIGILAIALSAQAVGTLPDRLVTAAFFIAFFTYAFTTGLCAPMYGDLVAKAITRGRGWYYGLVQLLGGGLGFTAAFVGSKLIARLGYPAGLQTCFWISVALSAVSLIFIARIREEPYPLPLPTRRFFDTLWQLGAEVVGNRDFRAFLIARSVLALAAMAVGFVVVNGRANGLQPSDVAMLAAVYVLSQALLGFGLGLVGNYLGFKLVTVLGGALLTVAMFGAAFASSIAAYVAVFAALGGANATTFVGDPNMATELASPSKTGLYIGGTSTILAFFLVPGPLVTGSLAKKLPYDAIFIAAGLIGLLGVALVLIIVREPRRPVNAAPVGQPGMGP